MYEGGGMSWVDISETDGVMLIVIKSGSGSNIKSASYIIETSTYNEVTKTYACTTVNGEYFEILVNKDKTVTLFS